MVIDVGLLLAIPATIALVEVVLALQFKTTLAIWIGQANASTALFRDKTLSDDEKQEKMAKASGVMFVGSMKLFGIITLALLAYLGVVWLGLLAVSGVGLAETVLRLEFQIVTLVAAILYLWVKRRVKK